MGHATPWNPSTARSTKTPCRCLAAVWQDVSVCGRDPELLHKLCGALDTELPPGRQRGSPAQADARASTAPVAVPETQAVTVARTRSSGGRIHDPTVDPAAHIQTDREAFRDPLPPGPCVAGDAEFGMDVAKTGAPGHAKGRGGHRPLEEIRVAEYKKKPEDLGPISSSSTKAGSSSFLTSARPGRLSARPPSLDTAIGEIEFPPSPPSPCPPRASVLDFTSVSTQPTSPAWRSSVSCAISCGICAGRSCSCGTAARSTGASSSVSFSNSTHGSGSIAFRLTPRNSTRTNLSGTTPSAHYPMARPEISPNCGTASTALSIAFETPSGCCRHASRHLTSRGRKPGYIH